MSRAGFSFPDVKSIPTSYKDGFGLVLVSLLLTVGARISVPSGRHQTLIYEVVLDNIINGVKEKNVMRVVF